jgi:UDP-N-acetylglucosamine 4-epimerase
MLKDRKVLVTGGAGFIGSNICKYLLEQGAYVRVLDNLITGRKSNIEPFLSHPHFEFLEGDIFDLEICKNTCQDIDYITHQAALGSVPRSIAFPEKTNESNVTGFLNMLIAAKENNVKRFVYASSSSVYGDEPTLPKREEKIGNPLSPYAVSKYTNELYAQVFFKTYGLETIGLRYFNVFGPNQDPEGQYAAVIPLFINNILQNKPIYINGDGSNTRDFTFVNNAVQANILALTTENEAAKGEIFNVAVGENFSLNDLTNAIQEILNIKAEIIHREERAGDIKNSLADISKITTLLKYKPSHTFIEGLNETVAYFKNL